MQYSLGRDQPAKKVAVDPKKKAYFNKYSNLRDGELTFLDRIEGQQTKSQGHYLHRELSKSDGSEFESQELDYIFRFLKQVNHDGVPIQDAIYPRRLATNLEIKRWKRQIHERKYCYKVVNSSHPDSFFSRFGTFGTQILSEEQ